MDIADGNNNWDSFDSFDSQMESPFMEKECKPTKSYAGGDISYKKSDIAKYILIALLIILIFYLFIRIICRVRFGGEDYYQRQTHHYFNNLHGETYDDAAKNAISYGESIPNPTAMDHYRIGTTYLVNAHDPQRAHAHYTQALKQVIDGKVDVNEVPFIIDRIDDYKEYFVDYPNIEELPIQRAIMANYEAKSKLLDGIHKAKIELNENDPNFTQKVLLSRQEWQSDSQNVHDSAIYAELNKQYRQVANENAAIPNGQTRTYDDAINWMKIRYRDEPDKLRKVDQVCKFFNENYAVGAMQDVQEKDIITNVWRRAHDPSNRDRLNDLRESIGDSVLDCVEGDNVVCMSGRNSKVWQALAHLDKDPEIGILKSKQVLRNEIYERSAKIVDNYLGNSGSASDALKDSYRNGENTEQVKELMDCMKQEVESLKKDYTQLLPNDQLDLIIEECKAVV